MTRRTLRLILLALACCFLASCASGRSFVRPGFNFANAGKVAVVVSADMLPDSTKREVGDLFGMELMRKGFSLTDRANLDQVLAEAKFQNESGITSPEGRAILRINNIQSLIVVNVGSFGEKVSLTTKMIDVNTGDVLWMGDGHGSTHKNMGMIGGAVVGALAGAAIGSAVRSDSVGILVGAGAGAVAGGVAGKMMEPEQAELVRDVIEETCEDLPNLVPQS